MTKKLMALFERWITVKIGVEVRCCLTFFLIAFFYCVYRLLSGTTAADIWHLTEMIAFLLPLYIEEGKHSLTIAVGCTGGHHRSVAVAHALAEWIGQQNYRVVESHRDINRG